jgi:hypothetical protein
MTSLADKETFCKGRRAITLKSCSNRQSWLDGESCVTKLYLMQNLSDSDSTAPNAQQEPQ